ncbi:hypothetical protein Rwratislav_37287 [Rhodococcus wratislaviensis IFP 2016]|nr:hypothetical protein Rwratislav_37287 [Rhodococcus wratislaviensis IFP 2016]
MNDMVAPERETTAIPARGIGLPGIILGIGLGGFVDGILLHQLLQWHHMLTSTDTDNVGIDTYPADTVHGLEILHARRERIRRRDRGSGT